MKPSPELRAIVSVDRWTGHGEGGTLYGVAVTGVLHSNPYDATEQDKQQASVDARWVQEAIEFYRAHQLAQQQGTDPK